MNIIKVVTASALATLLAGIALAGEFSDHCTTSLANDRMTKTKCEINTMVDGKTYCFGSEQARTDFMQDPRATIMKATAFYARNAEPEREKLTQEQAMSIIRSGNCDLSNKDLGYLDFKGMDLTHCKMVNTSFFGAYLIGANLSGTDMRSTNLTDATIFQAIFDKTNFSAANLTNARMIGTLGNVDMREAIIVNGRFGLDIGNQPMGQMKFDSVGGKFTNANFEGADLNIGNFSFGDLRGANLRNTNMYRADLSKADLTGADLTGANLTDADVDGATFQDAKGLESVKGFDTVKGKCKNCTVAKPASKSSTDGIMVEKVSMAARQQALACAARVAPAMN